MRSSIFISISLRKGYPVCDLRGRGGDSADKSFKSTRMVAGVKDMRFQAFDAVIPDIFHYLQVRQD